ncbi:MAG: CoA transferase, partial [Oscillospiraceae bacterium]
VHSILLLLLRADLVDNEKYNNCDRMNTLGLNSEVVAVLDEAIKNFTRAEILKIFKDNDLPCEACYEPADMYEDEQVWANGIMTKLDCPSGKRNIATNPVKFQSYPEPSYRVSSAQGTHTVEVMRELGYDEATIGNYLDSGAVVGKKALK